MGFTLGLVGLPNVGKSTLFNALTRSAQATVANYPFSTIEPATAEMPVPDERVALVAASAGSNGVVPTRLGFVDIAGLVQGASGGEGLGNRFLAHVREVDAVAHVLRCFHDPEVVHVEGTPDPVSEWETVNTELLIADLERVERRLSSLARRLRGGDRSATQDAGLLEMALELLRDGRPARLASIAESDTEAWRRLGLITAKPVLIVANTGGLDAEADARFLEMIRALSTSANASWIAIPAALEAEVAGMDDSEAAAFLAEFGVREPGLHRLVREGYGLLDLITFFTAGSKEARAWTLPRGSNALQAAGRIHTDFVRGFIRAEVVDWKLFAELGGEVAVRDAGRMRSEGRGYIVRDGDVIRFRFNV